MYLLAALTGVIFLQSGYFIKLAVVVVVDNVFYKSDTHSSETTFPITAGPTEPIISVATKFIAGVNLILNALTLYDRYSPFALTNYDNDEYPTADGNAVEFHHYTTKPA